jgi:hypothetical protein
MAAVVNSLECFYKKILSMQKMEDGIYIEEQEIYYKDLCFLHLVKNTIFTGK